uniref:phosphatidylinositol-3,4,5-trisphosphate 5-phosphatase n=1 Tax=Oryzias sinensis TaxID=183150 RepID=A0A8C7Z0E3_9TELE
LYQPWYHGNITRSKAENLLSNIARDGSFLIRDSESVQGAYALCIIYLLFLQASDGVPIRFFALLNDLVDAYYSPNMGLITHLQYPVPREEDIEDDQECSNLPPQLPPRKISPDLKENDSKTLEQASKSLSDTYQMRLQHVDMSHLSEEHQMALQEYFRTSICLDVEQAQNGNSNLPGLKKLLMAVCKNLNSEISRVLPALEIFHRALDQQLSPGCCTPLRIRKSLIPVVTFEVKQESIGMSTKMFLKVDVESGKLYFKKSKDGPEDKYFVHNKILKLVKSQKMHAKLIIMVETEKEKTLKKEFVFDDTKKREGFCQLLQQLKNKHSEKPEPDMITVFVGTWNMGTAGPPNNIDSWFQCKGQGKTSDESADHIPHDIYVIGTQEDPLSEREWAETVKSVLRKITNISFKLVASHTLWNIRIMILAKPEHENRISHIFSDSVKTGIANTLGNKGAVGVSFMFNGTSFGFVNSHLTSGSEKKLRRNQNYTNILRFLNLGDKKLNPFDITHRFTHLFWLGDLNYRVELPSTEAEYIVARIKQQQYQELLSKDQLNMERNDEKVFLHFDEEEITFPPTYRFERDTREKYAYTKAKATGTKYNLPSWCDRVLRKSYPLVHVVCHSYGCTNDIMTSDHSPVFASFEVGVASQFVSKQDPNTESQGGIQIMNCVAVLLTKAKTKFFIEFHSSCLESEITTFDLFSGGSVFQPVCRGTLLTPIISDPEYLLDQHILICVKSVDSDESYGEGCVALRAAQFCYREFQITLTHHGERTGTLTGGIQLHTSEGKPTEKLYGEAGDRLLDESMTVFFKESDNNPIDFLLLSDFIKVERDDAVPFKGKGGDKGADEPVSEMFDNPLYGSMVKTHGRGKEQGHSLTDHLTPGDPPQSSSKAADLELERPPLPTPRNRSYTCSENKPQHPTPTNLLPTLQKKPVVPSRSEGGTAPSRPPLPAKSRPEPQAPKSRDYRDISDVHNKNRAPARPAQPHKDSKEMASI